MITVNVWTGHASMVVAATAHDPETTMSWWPRYGDFAIYDGEPYVMPYATELRVEAGVDLRQYRIFTTGDHAAGVGGAREHVGLDLPAIHEWWRTWQSGRFRILDRNCCVTVISGLLAGGGQAYASLAGHEQGDPQENFLTTPDDVHRFCNAIVRGMDLARY